MNIINKSLFNLGYKNLFNNIRLLSTKEQLNLIGNDKTNEIQVINNVFNHVNKIVQDPRQSRLFAVVMVGGSQFKVTTEDVIIVKNHFYPTIGDKIRLEKVLLVGSKDFTVVGKPMLNRDFVNIEATVIEKTLTNDVIVFRYKPRKDNRRMDFHKGIHTLLRINSIDIIGPIPGTNNKINQSNN